MNMLELGLRRTPRADYVIARRLLRIVQRSASQFGLLQDNFEWMPEKKQLAMIPVACRLRSGGWKGGVR